MEEFFSGLVIGALAALLAGLIAYSSATDTVQQQAIAAGVACWKINPEGGVKQFSWRCDK